MGTSSGRVGGWLAAHPVALLLLLTPGIPEYLSGSSAVSALVSNPSLFLFQLPANVGLYGSGALLVREAKVRWNKGWATVFILGAAYGILEEGVALSTLFDPAAGPVGSLGSYGHWLGVSWVWLAGIVPFHAIFSVTLPILLLGLALPGTSRKSLLSMRQIAITFMILALDVVLLMVVVNRASGYWMGWPILVSSLLSIGALVWAGFRVPSTALTLGSGGGEVSDRALAAVGVSFFPAVILTEGLAQEAGLPAAVGFVLMFLVQAVYPAYLARRTWHGRPRGTIALAAGLLVPIAALGVIAELALPLTILADLAAIAFLRFLWAKYSAGQTRPQSRQPTASSATSLTLTPFPCSREAFRSLEP